MKMQYNNAVFKSFEQMKAELFPALMEDERRKSLKFDSSQIGVSLADEAIKELFRERAAKKA